MARDEEESEDQENSLLSADDGDIEEEVDDMAGTDSSASASDLEEQPRKRGASKAKPVLSGRPPKPPASSQRPQPPRPTAEPAPRPSRPAVSRLDDGDDEEPLSEEALQKRRDENIKALLSNSLQTCRQPLMSKFLTVMESQVVLRKPFQSPMQGAPAMSDALRRKLVARRHFVPWGSSTPLPVPTMPVKPPPTTPSVPEPPQPEPSAATPPEPALPEGIEPLVLWQAPPGCGEGPGEVTVDNMLVRFLRPHQREGVQFMFDCVTGQRLEGKQGCILADDMGLGKTLQGITLLWTLLTGGHPLLGGHPIARRAIIVCPTSLVSNWDNECTKWLQGRLKTLAMCESSREDVVANIGMFLHASNVYKVLIISYETFRMHAERFQVPHACDLLVCDEAHRLKNDATLTNRALDNLPCKRRVLLSGTPMQNHLDEFFAMVDFCNPGVLGAPAQFRKHYELPILAGREPDAAPEEAVLGEERSRELSGLTNNFILRRTNKLLSQHLPPKVIEVVCCRLTDLQRQLYCHFLQSKAARRVLNGRTSGVLSAITSLKKLCNHPKLIYDAVNSKAAALTEEGEGKAEGFEDVGSLFPPGLFDNGRVGRGGMAHGWEAVSGKMAVLARMLHVLYTETTDRIVLVSNYTSTLDLFAQLCRERGYPFVRLDGTTTINKRQKLVKVFNDPAERQFAFLLSSKAGGCGLNLIGANRLVLFDPDWNPANDQQAAARVWRDGQRKRVFVYRFLSTGSIEEKVYQRQLSKEGLKQLVSKNGKAAANVMTAEDLRELFTLNGDTWSDTYDYMCGGPGAAAEVPVAGRGGGPIDLAGDEDDDDGGMGGKGGAGGTARGAGAGGGCGGDVGADEPCGRLPPVHKRQAGEPAEEDLANWGHHPAPDTVPDAVMRRVAAPDVSFIFSCSVAGKAIEGGDEEERRLAEGAAATAAGPGPGVAGASVRGRTGSGRMGAGGGALTGSGGGGGGVAPAATARAVSTPLPTVPAPKIVGAVAATPQQQQQRPASMAMAGSDRKVATGGPVRSGPSATSAPPQTRPQPAAVSTPMPPACAAAAPSASGVSATAAVRPPVPTPAAAVAGAQQQQHATPAAAVASAAAAAAASTPGHQALRAPGPGEAERRHPQANMAPARPPPAPLPPSSKGPAAAAGADGSRPQGTAAGPAGQRPSLVAPAAAAAASGTTSGPRAPAPRPPSSVTGAVVSSQGPGGKVAVPPSAAAPQPKAAAPLQAVTAQSKPVSTKAPTAPTPPAAAAGGGPPSARTNTANSKVAPAPTAATAPWPVVTGGTGQGAKGAVQPVSGGGAGAVAVGRQMGVAAGAVATAAGDGKASRGRDEGPGGGGQQEAPKPKRQRAPGWYIDDDDDDFM